MNSSYVLIIITTFRRISERVRARPPATQVSILCCQCAFVLQDGRNWHPFGGEWFSSCGTNYAGANDWEQNGVQYPRPNGSGCPRLGRGISEMEMPGYNHSGQAHAADRAEGNLPPWGFSPFGANTIRLFSGILVSWSSLLHNRLICFFRYHSIFQIAIINIFLM